MIKLLLLIIPLLFSCNENRKLEQTNRELNERVERLEKDLREIKIEKKNNNMKLAPKIKKYRVVNSKEDEVVVEEEKYNVNQSLISIGNGNMLGKGYGSFELNKLGDTLDKTNIHNNDFHIQAPWDKN